MNQPNPQFVIVAKGLSDNPETSIEQLNDDIATHMTKAHQLGRKSIYTSRPTLTVIPRPHDLPPRILATVTLAFRQSVITDPPQDDANQYLQVVTNRTKAALAGLYLNGPAEIRHVKLTGEERWLMATVTALNEYGFTLTNPVDPTKTRVFAWADNETRYYVRVPNLIDRFPIDTTVEITDDRSPFYQSKARVTGHTDDRKIIVTLDKRSGFVEFAATQIRTIPA